MIVYLYAGTCAEHHYSVAAQCTAEDGNVCTEQRRERRTVEKQHQ